MYFQNPLNTLCPACGDESQQNVADLVSLSAHCPKCGASLSSTGLEIRKAHDAWSTHCLKLELALSLEEHLTGAISDEELEPIATLADLIALLELRLSKIGASDESARDLLALAIDEVRSNKRADRSAQIDWNLHLQVPIVEVFDPDRWTESAIEVVYPRSLHRAGGPD